uniref:Chromosome (Plasmid) partitioning protein ParB n=1 Tax=Sphingomonas sp. JE1 TaxID=1628059 RepID=A0A0D4ZZH1_9SPHN|nr:MULTISPECIES: ParB/RepB/Spo0J family partition protein [unclassified Sphingomonas]AJW29652.1 Chromosome (plasmid) partitioning protein ParB [Sphingomonas sp. JE1]
MSSGAGRRRSLLTNAIDSLGTSPAIPDTEANVAQSEEAQSEPRRREPSPPSFLERRGIAIEEIGRTVKRLTIRLRPDECSVWPGNAREYANLTYERCASLIDSIKEENGNREPVVVRRTPDAEKPYELIVGTRRHYSVSWLRENNHAELDLIARIETLDDEGAFRLADIENREREDVTDLERARNYLHAIDAYYNGVRSHMADRLAIGKQNLHNLLQLAELPNEVVQAFADPSDLKVRHGMKLSPLLKQADFREAILDIARELAKEQAERRASGQEPIDGPEVYQRLAAASSKKEEKPARRPKAAMNSAGGDEIGLIVSDTKAKGITININPKRPIDVEEILAALRPVIESAKFSKR